MKVIARRLTVIGAVALSGAAAGVALGDFVARPGMSRPSAMDMTTEAAGARFDDPLDPVALARPARAAPVGPSSYSCEGCDARLHDDMMADDAISFADVEPLPAYRPEEGMVPELPLQQEAAVTGPRVQVPSIMLSGVEGSTAGAPKLMAVPGD